MHILPASTVSFLVVLTIGSSSAFQIMSGTCPQIETVESFNMERFLGKWFIIQGSKTGDDVKAESCVILNFTHLDQDTYLSTQLPQNWTTKLRFNGDKNQSHLLIKLDETNETPFHIVATDYENYGSFFICESKAGEKMRRAAAILSRKPKLEENYHKLIREQLVRYHMEADDMTGVMSCDNNEI